MYYHVQISERLTSRAGSYCGVTSLVEKRLCESGDKGLVRVCNLRTLWGARLLLLRLVIYVNNSVFCLMCRRGVVGLGLTGRYGCELDSQGNRAS